jgi:cell division protein FtsL
LKDKKELLEDIEDIINPKKKLDFKFFIYTILCSLFIISLAFFKIYLNQQIYYESRKIKKLKNEYEVLKEENRVINSAVESIRFKNQIADTLFDEE